LARLHGASMYSLEKKPYHVLAQDHHGHVKDE
jgi:hypothetical protein